MYSYSWAALDKTVSLKALEALEEILFIPSFSANLPEKLVLTGPLEDKRFEVSVNASIIQCNDHPPFEKDAITYGKCAVLSFFDLFWCPILGCVISPKRKSILLYQDLEKYVREYPYLQDHSSALLIEHISQAFQLNPKETLDTFYRNHDSVSLKFPIPGLDYGEKKYRCPKCHLWYATHRGHAKISPTCQKNEHPPREFSIALYPSEKGGPKYGHHFRIKLIVPDHRDYAPEVKQNKKLRLGKDTEGSMMTSTLLTTQESEDILLIQAWLQPSYSNVRGPSAPKLQKDEKGFKFTQDIQTFSCLHSSPFPKDNDSEFYTGCAVLCFFQLFFSPILHAVVSPLQKTLVGKRALQTIFNNRIHGQDTNTLLGSCHQFIRFG